MTDIVEVYVHWYAGRPKSQLAASLGLDRKTIRKYLAPAEAAGITPGGPPMSEADWAKLIKSWFPERANRRLNQLTWPEIDQHRDYVKELLDTCTVTTIHQRLREAGSGDNRTAGAASSRDRPPGQIQAIVGSRSPVMACLSA